MVHTLFFVLIHQEILKLFFFTNYPFSLSTGFESDISKDVFSSNVLSAYANFCVIDNPSNF